MKSFTRLCQLCMLLMICMLLLQKTNAQNCGCQFTVSPSNNWEFDGIVHGVQPGDTICLTNGIRTADPIRFIHLRGTREHPIVITNACNSKFIISMPQQKDGLIIDSSAFVHVTGSRPTNIPNDPYGIELRGGNMGMRIQALSTDVEVDHIKLSNIGCAGIVAHTDPTCDERTWRANFIMRNVKIHDNYLTHIGCEGFYIGNSHYDEGRTGLGCPGTAVVMEHAVDTVEVYNNYLENIGQDGIQVGGGFHTTIHHNIVKHWSEKHNRFDVHGIQVGSGTTQARVYDNILDDGDYAFTDQGGGTVWYNNVASNCRLGGIYMSDPPSGYAPTGFVFVNNTLVNYSGIGIEMYAFNPATRSAVKNNILVGDSGSSYFKFNDNTQPLTDTASNYTTTSIANLRFVYPDTMNYHLQRSSPAIDRGVNTSSNGVTTDLDGVARPQWGAYDIGAYEYNGTLPPSTDTTTPPPPTDTVASYFNFTDRSQTVNGWISIDAPPHARVVTATDVSTGFKVSSISTAQWPPANINDSIMSAFNGGTTTSGPTVQPVAVMVSHWFNYNAPYGATVNGVVQGDNLAITGLRPNTTYSLKVGGSRRTLGAAADMLGTMEYRFNGSNPQFLKVTDNATRQVEVTATSDANGRIGISARKILDSSCNYGYLGWLIVKGSKAASGSRIATATNPQVQETLAALSVYPIPAGNSATLNLAAFREQAVEVSLLSAVGTLIQHRTYKGGYLYTINTSGLSNGLYFIQVNTGKKKIITRIVINR